jgi:lipopolysaccharide biosynthesis glycosyltransferase
MLMNVVTATNNKYLRYAYVMLYSLFVNNADEQVRVFVLTSKTEELEDKERKALEKMAASYHGSITWVEVDQNRFPKEIPTNEQWTIEAYYRLMLIDILPEDVDRLLYIDVDIIIDKSLKELYETDFEGNEFCVCAEMISEGPFNDIRNELFKESRAAGHRYFNSGFMLWNMNLLRTKYSFASYLELARNLQYKLFAPDQDLLNLMHWQQVKYVDEYRYDLFARFASYHGVTYEDVKNSCAVVHFAGVKPWEGDFVHYDIEQLWWDYAKETPYYEEFLAAFMNELFTGGRVLQLFDEQQQENRQLHNQVAQISEKFNTILKQLKQ